MSNPLSRYPPEYRKLQYLAYLLRLSNKPCLPKPKEELKYLPCSEETKLASDKAQKDRLAKSLLTERDSKAFIKAMDKHRLKPVDLEKDKPAITVSLKKKDKYQKLGNWYYPIIAMFVSLLTVPIIIQYFKSFSLSIFRLITFSLVAIIEIITLGKLLAWIIDNLRVQAHNESIDLSKMIIVRDGAPGAGKTSSLIYDMVLLAQKRWEEIQYQYWLLKPNFEKIARTGSQDEQRRCREIVEAYEYYSSEHIVNGTKTKIVPCLHSNIPIYVDGLPCSKLLVKHIMQESKLPYGAVCLGDEFGLMIPQELHQNKPPEIKEIAKFPRHFGDFHFGLTEQDQKNMFIEFRRCTCENKYMLQQKWELQPWLLNWLFKILQRRYTKHEPTPERVSQLKSLDRLRRNVGFRKYSYIDRGNENNLEGVSSKKTIVLPVFLNANYDSRTFKNLYRARDKAIEPDIWSNLVIPDETLKELFRDDILEKCKSKKEQKNARKKA